MSGGQSSRSTSKPSVAGSARSAHTTQGQNPSDRWTHNITYQQLVASASIGLLQTWRFPCLVQRHGGLPCVLVYLLFSLLLGYPMHYLELAIGMVTRKGVLRSWDLAPVGRGIGWAMLLVSAHTAFALSVIGAYSLAMLAETLRKDHLPWQNCVNYNDVNKSDPCVPRQVLSGRGQLTPTEAFVFRGVIRPSRVGLDDGLGKVNGRLALCFGITWLFIYLVVIKGIYSYSKVVFFQALLTFFVIFVFSVGVIFLDTPFNNFAFGAQWEKLKEVELYRAMAEHVLMELAVAQGTVVMLGSYNVESRKLHQSTITSVLVSNVLALGSLLVLSRSQEALDKDYDLSAENQLHKGPSIPLVLWADLVVRVVGNRLWSGLVFFTLFTLTVCTVALLLQTLLSNVQGRHVDKLKWVVTLLVCIVFAVVGVLTLCTQGGVYVMGLLDFWPASMPRLLVAALTAFVISVAYGQKSFCEDVYFTVEEYPNAFLRVCWAIDPIILLVLFVCGLVLHVPPAVYGVPLKDGAALAGWLLVALTLLPVPVLMLLYLVFWCRIRNIVDSEK